MTSEELAARVTARVLGVGHEQYSLGSEQKFEHLPIYELFEWTQEELDDVIVYAVMLSIRLERLQDAVAHAGKQA